MFSFVFCWAPPHPLSSEIACFCLDVGVCPATSQEALIFFMGETVRDKNPKTAPHPSAKSWHWTLTGVWKGTVFFCWVGWEPDFWFFLSMLQGSAFKSSLPHTENPPPPTIFFCWSESQTPGSLGPGISQALSLQSSHSGREHKGTPGKSGTWKFHWPDMLMQKGKQMPRPGPRGNDWCPVQLLREEQRLYNVQSHTGWRSRESAGSPGAEASKSTRR